MTLDCRSPITPVCQNIYPVTFRASFSLKREVNRPSRRSTGILVSSGFVPACMHMSFLHRYPVAVAVGRRSSWRVFTRLDRHRHFFLSSVHMSNASTPRKSNAQKLNSTLVLYPELLLRHASQVVKAHSLFSLGANPPPPPPPLRSVH